MLSGSANARALPTPEQIEGPFHPVTPHPDTDFDMTIVERRAQSAVGDQILVRGRVQDVDGNPLADATVDIWQANHFGRYSHPQDENTAPLDPNFQGWALLATGHDGSYGIKTIMPGPYPLFFFGDDGWRCRHIHFKVTCDGYDSLTTQMYFYEDPWLAYDGQIAKVPEEQRHLLIAKRSIDEDSGLPRYRFNITLAKSDVNE